MCKETYTERVKKAIDEIPAKGVSGTLYDDNDNDVVLPVYLTKPKNRTYKERWAIMFLTDDTDDNYEESGVSLFEQSVANKLNLTDYRVRDYVFCRIGIGNYVHVNQSDAAKKLKIPRPNISKSIKKLVELGIILKGPKNGNFCTYQVNPAVLYAGSISNGVKAKKDIVRQRKDGATVYKFPSL